MSTRNSRIHTGQQVKSGFLALLAAACFSFPFVSSVYFFISLGCCARRSCILCCF